MQVRISHVNFYYSNLINRSALISLVGEWHCRPLWSMNRIQKHWDSDCSLGMTHDTWNCMMQSSNTLCAHMRKKVCQDATIVITNGWCHQQFSSQVLPQQWLCKVPVNTWSMKLPKACISLLRTFHNGIFVSTIGKVLKILQMLPPPPNSIHADIHIANVEAVPAYGVQKHTISPKRTVGRVVQRSSSKTIYVTSIVKHMEEPPMQARDQTYQISQARDQMRSICTKNQMCDGSWGEGSFNV